MERRQGTELSKEREGGREGRRERNYEIGSLQDASDVSHC